jgi:hypothetical protein
MIRIKLLSEASYKISIRISVTVARENQLKAAVLVTVLSVNFATQRFNFKLQLRIKLYDNFLSKFLVISASFHFISFFLILSGVLISNFYSNLNIPLIHSFIHFFCIKSIRNNLQNKDDIKMSFCSLR